MPDYTGGRGLTALNRAMMAPGRQAQYYGAMGGMPGGDQEMLEYGMGARAERYLPEITGLAAREQTAIQAGAAGVPYGPDAYAPGLMQYGLERQIAAPGMSPVEYTQAKRRITQGFGAQTGALASAGARGGYFSPASVAQAGGGAPAQQLGQGFAELEARNAEIQRREREAGVRTLASQYPGMSRRAYGPYDAYMAQTGQYREQTPVQYHGIQTTRPSRTHPGPIPGTIPGASPGTFV
jgi:hypothetical protein